MFRFGLLFVLTLLLSVFLFYLYKKYNKKQVATPCPDNPSNASIIYKIIIFFECAMLYALLALILSTAWLKGDDYIFLQCTDYTLKEKFFFILGRYSCWNSRLGDIIASLLALSENRWQHIFITPFFIIALPFVIFNFLTPSKASIFSLKGFIFILFTVFIILVSVSLTPWRNIWCYAAAVNYLWPMAIVTLLLTYYKKNSPSTNKLKSKYLIILVFLLGLYSTWSLECITVLLLPALSIWIIWKYRRGIHITAHCWAGFMGAIWGAFFLFSSPGLARRSAKEVADRAFDPSVLSFDQMWEFVTTQTPENLTLLQAGTVRYILDGIPLPLHIFYIPELLKHFIPCCAAALICWVVFCLCALTKKPLFPKKHIRISCIFVCLAFLSAFAYLYACIPTDMSYLPSSYLIVLACSLLFLNIQGQFGKISRIVSTVVLMIYASVQLFPSVGEAWRYKKYEKIRLAELHSQIDRGEQDVVIYQPYTIPPKDELGLIHNMDLQQEANIYPNFIAARAYKINSITLMPHKSASESSEQAPK